MKDEPPFTRYCRQLRCRIAKQTQETLNLRALIVRKKRINLNNSGLPYRIHNGVLIPHRYNQD